MNSFTSPVGRSLVSRSSGREMGKFPVRIFFVVAATPSTGSSLMGTPDRAWISAAPTEVYVMPLGYSTTALMRVGLSPTTI